MVAAPNLFYHKNDEFGLLNEYLAQCENPAHERLRLRKVLGRGELYMLSANDPDSAVPAGIAALRVPRGGQQFFFPQVLALFVAPSSRFQEVAEDLVEGIAHWARMAGFTAITAPPPVRKGWLRAARNYAPQLLQDGSIQFDPFAEAAE